jgi:hypothetical protein
MLPQRAGFDAAAKSRLGCCRKEQTLMLPQRAGLDAAAKSRLGCCCKIKLDLYGEQTWMLLQDRT